MTGDSEMRKSIYASIIASIIVIILIQPILSVTGRAITWAGDHLYSGISASTYIEAAIGHREKFSFIGLIFICSLLSGIIVGIVSGFFFRGRLGTLTKKGSHPIFKAVILIISVSSFFMTIFVLATNFADFQMNASFNQRLAVLTLAISDQKVKEFRAQWASMQMRNDYLAINNEMEKLATQKGIRLPKLLWK